MVLTRTKCRNENPYVLALVLNVTFVLAGLAGALLLTVWAPDEAQVASNTFLLGGWTELGGREWLAMIILATAVLLGSVLTAIAYQSGPSSLVSTFDFSYLAFAALWGALFFAEIPDAAAALGIMMIAAAGVLVVRRKTG